jgi:hypothetical protein
MLAAAWSVGHDQALGYVQFNAIWDGTGNTPDADKCLDLLAMQADATSGIFFTTDADAIPHIQCMQGPTDYTWVCSPLAKCASSRRGVMCAPTVRRARRLSPM